MNILKRVKKMKNFHWNTIGIGKINIIILNGWGINSKIWLFVIKKLRYDFKFHLIERDNVIDFHCGNKVTDIL